MPDANMEELSSSEVRDQIFSQHVMLRGLLAETVEMADVTATSTPSPRPSREDEPRMTQ